MLHLVVNHLGASRQRCRTEFIGNRNIHRHAPLQGQAAKMERPMRSLIILTMLPLVTAIPAQAQDAATTLNQAQSSPGDAQTIQQQVQNKLQEAGFTDIQIMPSSFLVRAKDKAGNPVMMVISPDSVTTVTEVAAPSGLVSQGNSAGGGVNAPPGNSGAGIPGQPGNKSGPTANSSSGTVGSTGNAPAQSPTQDVSKVPGLPGGKSGPPVRPPSASAPK
jgi:hypothetical protein